MLYHTLSCRKGWMWNKILLEIIIPFLLDDIFASEWILKEKVVVCSYFVFRTFLTAFSIITFFITRCPILSWLLLWWEWLVGMILTSYRLVAALPLNLLADTYIRSLLGGCFSSWRKSESIRSDLFFTWCGTPPESVRAKYSHGLCLGKKFLLLFGWQRCMRNWQEMS